MTVRAHVHIAGRVQGVGYRASAERQAARRGVTGWVRNCADGSVEAVFEGGREAVEGMIAWCRQGPSMSKVIDVEVTWETPAGESEGFGVKY